VTGDDVRRWHDLEPGVGWQPLVQCLLHASYMSHYHLIGPGSGNNLMVRETAHLTIDGDDVVASHDAFSIECK